MTGDIHTNFSDNTSVTGNTWINLDEAGIEDPIVTTSGSLYNDKLDLKWDFSENDDNTPKCTGLLSISADENVVVAGCTDTRTGRVLLLDLNTFCNYDNEYTNGTVAALDNGLKVNYYYDESGNRIDNCGTITLEKVGNVLGQSVDVIITIESVIFSNSYASYLYEDDYNGNTGYWNIGNNKFANGVLLAKPQTKEKIIIGAWASGESEYSMQFCTTYDEYYDSNPYYSNSAYQRAFQFQFGYSYPCTQNVTASFKVVYSESGNVVDSQFLVVGSDIDVYRDGTDSHKRVFSEGFSTLAGFTGTFYKYTTNKNYIVGTGLGVMTARATVETSGGTSGVTSHTYAGVYAESKTGEWTCLYTDQQCGTYVEIYSPTYYDITIKKVSAADTAETLSGVQFKLYRLTDENEKEYYNSNNGGITSWGDSDSAKVITTNGTDGTAEIKNLEPGNYYLTEVVAANGYALLDHDIEITVSTFGVVSLEDTEDHASVDNSGGTVLLTIKNDKAYDVTLLKIDENGNAITDNPATFYLYKKIGDVEYYYKYDVSDYDHVTYVTTWVTDLNEATRIVTDTGTGQAALHDLTLGTTYYLRETDAPYGYSLLQEDASFTLESDESVTISPSSTGILSYSGCFADSDLVIKVKNEEADVYTIRIYKRDEVTNNVISEIKFSLYRLDEDGNKIYYYFLDSTVYWYADKKRIYSTSEYGSVNFTKLYPGTYYLQEESTVDGYFKLDENAVLGFTISEDGVVSLVDNADTDVIKLGKGDGDENNPASLTLCVYNTPYYELPSAGGSGTVPYTCVGVTLTAGAAGLLYRRRRKGKFA